MRLLIILITTLLSFSSYNLIAQSEYSEMVLKNEIDSGYVKLINKKELHEILNSHTAEIYMVSIYSNFCSGTKYLLENVDTLESEFKGRIKFVLCSVSPYKEIPLMLKVLKKFNIDTQPVYVINSKNYKDKKSDARVKGRKFRDDICKDCRGIIIGVPFTFLYDENGKMIERGYPTQIDYKKTIRNYFQNHK